MCRRCLLKSPSGAAEDDSSHQDGSSDGADNDVGAAGTCGGRADRKGKGWPYSRRARLTAQQGEPALEGGSSPTWRERD